MKIDLMELLRDGVQAHEQGDLETARSAYEKILEVAPGHADATHLLGVIGFQVGDFGAAQDFIERAIAVDARVPMYHANLGRVRRAVRDDAGAISAFKDAVRLDPNNGSLHADLASAYIGAGEYDAARSRCHLALELDPSLATAHLNLGLALQELKSSSDDEAIQSIERALVFDPKLPGGYLALGVAAQERGDPSKAMDYYMRALQLNPAFVEAHCNLGNIERDAMNFEIATQHYRDALEIDDAVAEVWGNLGVALQEQGDLDGALDAYDRAVSLSPKAAGIRRNRGMAHLAAGNYTEGWADYEYRWKTKRFRPLIREFGVPLWDGSDPKGMRILVHAEQGFGDTIQFSRFVPLLANLGAAVTFECPDALLPLMPQLPGIKGVIAFGAPLPKLDAHVPLLSLPGRLGITVATIPPPAALVPPQEKVSEWAERVASWPKGKRVGIAWRGSPDHPRDDLRSPGLEPFLSLLDTEGVQLVSLQKENAADELASLPDTHRIIDPTQNLDDFADTAALIAHLDLIIACDSAPLHLAGAIGSDAIAILPYVAEWRWAIKDTETPWYPTVRLFRQASFGDWAGVIERIATDLGCKND